MANRLFSPNQQYSDTTGLPYGSGSLVFYASGTSTPLATYTNRALTIPNLNPLLLDSAGRAGDVFLQNLAYKVVLCSDPLGLVPVWTADPVYSSDFSTVASFLSGAGSPNGVVAGSAGSATVPASVYWDTTNNILYVATVTGNAATTVWTAVNASSATAAVPPPQGRLTLTSGAPVMPASVISATAVFYDPYVGNLVPIYNGTSLIPTVFSELALTLSASHALNTIYDVFVFSNVGVLTLATGPAWTNSTAGAGARGTGAATSQLTRVGGLWVNAVSMSARNGATTYTIGANLGTYVGSIFIDGVAGQITCHTTWGQSRKWGVWNAYNRSNIWLRVGDSTASWTTAPTTWRASRATAANSLTTFCGLLEETIDLRFMQMVDSLSANSSSNANIGIGFNGTTAAQGKIGENKFALITVGGSMRSDLIASYQLDPVLGISTISAIEQAPSGTTNNTFFGSETYMRLLANWLG